ncbi:MAG: hypothetical protein COA50_11150 [Flavobacteriaceae bacterium]|nr:MAG: hypothetical protein COA50_11150 [Flavobacteriaceae bacterium]
MIEEFCFFVYLVMSSSSGLKGAFIGLFVVGLIGMIIRYLFGGDGNRSVINEIFLDVLSVFWWIIRYILLPLFIISLIALAFQDKKK